MQTDEYLEFRDKARMQIQQNLVPITIILSYLDDAFDMGEAEGLRQIETKLSPADMEKFQRALGGPEIQPEDTAMNRLNMIRKFGIEHTNVSGREYYMKSKDQNNMQLWCRDFSSLGGSAEHDVVLNNLNVFEMSTCYAYRMELRSNESV